jgi:hypothetical protein
LPAAAATSAATDAERLQDQLSILSKARGPGAISRAIASAVEQYSKDRPLEKAVSVDGDGGFDYALPSGFVDGFSMVHSSGSSVGRS